MGLELKWSDAHKHTEDSCPRTAWFANKERFTTRARTIDHERGMLRLAGAHDKWNLGKDSPFDVYQVDPDGAALKTVNFLLTAQNLVAKSLSLGKPPAKSPTAPATSSRWRRSGQAGSAFRVTAVPRQSRRAPRRRR